MSGVNAHAIFSSHKDMNLEAHLARPAPWSHMRCWPCPAPHPLLSLMVSHPRSSIVEYVCRLGQPALGFLMDHEVSGQVLVPATAFMDLMRGALRCVQHHSSALLLNVSISTAKVLPGVLKNGDLVCTLDTVVGTVAVVTPEGSGSATSHVAASVSSVQRPAHLDDDYLNTAHTRHMNAHVVLPWDRSRPVAHRIPARRVKTAQLYRSRQEGGGYVVHPAAADATLHLGAVGQKATAIPVGIQAAIANLGSDAERYALAEVPHHAPNDSMTLLSDSRMGESMTNVGLISRIIQRPAAKKKPLAERCIDWQSSDLQMALAAGVRQQGQGHNVQAMVGAASTTIYEAPEYIAAGALLTVLQGSFTQPTPPGMNVHAPVGVHHGGPAGGSVYVASAVSAAMMKSAAVEERDGAWSVVQSHTAAPGNTLVGVHSDQHGALVAGGVVSRPQLLHCSR